MASVIIHLAVAKTLERHFKLTNKRDYYLGAIAPDISKQIGKDKKESHFLIDTPSDIPNIDIFIKKYPKFIENSFDLGYFIHLYTDKIWFSKFISQIINGNYIRLLDGTIIRSTPKQITDLIYQDYTNLNIQLIDEYKMDLSLFYEDFIPPTTTIKEIPTDKLNILIDQMSIIIENSQKEKSYTFDLFLVLQFIDECSQEILDYLMKIEETN